MSMKVGIVGLGLIGGSFAKAIKQNTEHTVWGYDISETVIQQAITAKAIDGFLSNDRLGSCDMVIVALYPEETVKYITKNADQFRKNSVVMDCCGVKGGVVSAIAPIANKSGFYFIGGHPMAGIEFSGFTYSKPDLFLNASMILTPTTDTDSEIVDMVGKFCMRLGFGHIQLSTPEHHDRMIALTSQLAHVISSAYVQSDTALDFKGFSAGSFIDMTRVARLNEHMWTELFIENSKYLTDEIDGMIDRLKHFSDIIKTKNKSELIETLKQGSDRKKLLSGEELF